MEGKTVILSVLIMSLVMAKIQVEAVNLQSSLKSCCVNTIARQIYNMCRATGDSMPYCASSSGCKIIVGDDCPPGYPNDILENHGDAVNEYCKLGCASSVCGALTTLQNSDASEIVNAAVEQCTKACSTLCTKGPVNAVEIA